MLMRPVQYNVTGRSLNSDKCDYLSTDPENPWNSCRERPDILLNPGYSGGPANSGGLLRVRKSPVPLVSGRILALEKAPRNLLFPGSYVSNRGIFTLFEPLRFFVHPLSVPRE